MFETPLGTFLVIFAVFGAMDDGEGVGRSGRPMVRWKGHEVLFQRVTIFYHAPLGSWVSKPKQNRFSRISTQSSGGVG